MRACDSGESVRATSADCLDATTAENVAGVDHGFENSESSVR